MVQFLYLRIQDYDRGLILSKKPKGDIEKGGKHLKNDEILDKQLKSA